MKDKILNILNKVKDITERLCKINIVWVITVGALLLTYGLIILSTVVPYNKENKVKYSGIELNVKMVNTDSNIRLQYEPVSLNVKVSDNDYKVQRYLEIDSEIFSEWQSDKLNIKEGKFKVDNTEYEITDDLSLLTLDCYNNFLYATYTNNNSTAMREVLISKEMPSDLVSDEFDKVAKNTWELSKNKSIKTYKYSYDSSRLYISDEIAGGKLGSKSLVKRINKLENNLKYSEIDLDAKEKVIINFEELGSIDLNSIKDFNNSAGIYLSNTDGVLRLYNYKTDKTLIYVTSINNSTFMCNDTDLVETNYDNLLITNDFDNKNSVGYRTFVLKTENNMYVFRLDTDAKDSVLKNFLNKFDIDSDKIEVKVVQSVIDKE